MLISCRFEDCDGKEHRCSVCAGMGYICHVRYGSTCPGCHGKGRWPCPSSVAGQGGEG